MDSRRISRRYKYRINKEKLLPQFGGRRASFSRDSVSCGIAAARFQIRPFGVYP
jgi:hypothetical protein